MKKIISVLLVCLLLIGALSACGSAKPEAPVVETASGEKPAQETVVAKLAHTAAADGCYQIGAEKFAELVYEKTDGAVKIEVYPNSQLGSDNEIYESLQMSAVQFDIAGFDGMGAFVPDVKIFNLPFLYSSREEVFSVLDSELFKELTEQYLQYNIRFLGCFDAGFRQLQTTDTAINSIEDLKGLKIRVPEDPAFMSAMEALGAAPTPTAYSECFMSLQSGVIDGIEVPLDVFGGNGFGEVCKYFAYTNYIFNAPALYVADDFYQSLTPEQQQAIQDAAQEAIAYERQWIAENEASVQAQIEEEWGVTFTHPDLAPFQEACATLHSECANPKLLAEIYSILGR